MPETLSGEQLIPIYPHGQLIPGDEHYPSAQAQSALSNWGDDKKIPMDDLMRVLRWDSMNGCFAFWWTGIYMGVETDGHIHT